MSFSYNGKNQGCINIEAEAGEKAIQKAKDLKIVPKHDDVEIYEMLESELPLNVLVSIEQLTKMSYESQQRKKKLITQIEG